MQKHTLYFLKTLNLTYVCTHRVMGIDKNDLFFNTSISRKNRFAAFNCKYWCRAKITMNYMP